MYARLACATGWTWEYIREYVTIPIAFSILRYFRDQPPINESFAGFIGYKKAPDQKPQAPDDIDNLIADVLKVGGEVHRRKKDA